MSAAHPPIRLLRNVATSRIIRALEQDGFRFVERQGSQRVYHIRMDASSSSTTTAPKTPYRPYVIRNLLTGTRWSEADLRRLKLIR